MHKAIVFDAETFLITPGNAAPKLVCLGALKDDDETLLTHNDNITLAFECWAKEALETETVLVNHNMVFDMAVLAAYNTDLIPLIFELYEKNRVECTLINQKLIDNADGVLRLKENIKGYYSLGGLVQKYFNHELDKDTWRTGYAQFYDVPVAEWPEGAKQYVLEDVRWTHKLWQEQVSQADDVGYIIPDSRAQARNHWALHLMSVWGIKTDASSVSQLEQRLTAELKELEKKLQDLGFIRENGSKNLSAIRSYIADHVEYPIRTNKGAISTSKEALEEANIPALGEFNHKQKLLSTYVKALKQGTSMPLHCGVNPLLETGRISNFKPNLTNLPREPGVRECFVPRPGNVFCAADYATLELRTLAQCCIWMLGYSNLGQALNNGLDPHLQLGAQLLGLSYEEAKFRYKNGDKQVSEYRQMAKVANFGFPGGMGPEKFIVYAATQGVKLTFEQSYNLKQGWLRQWPEMYEYFRYVSCVQADADGFETVVQFKSNRVRGGCNYTVSCNTRFQGLAADGAKYACFLIQKANYVSGSILQGSRLVAFIHDETICEHPEDEAPERAVEQARLMEVGMQEFVPDIKIVVEPTLMRNWNKAAKSVFDSNGRLMVWTPDSK